MVDMVHVERLALKFTLKAQAQAQCKALELGIPRGAVSGFQWPLSSVPEQWTQLKPFLPATNRVDRPFVTQINILPNDKTLGILIRQNG